MGIYSNNKFIQDSTLKRPEQLQEALVYLELAKQNDDVKKQFINSTESKVMISEGIITDRVPLLLIQENRNTRNIKLASLQLARENGDVLWDKILEARIRERSLINEVVNKYGENAIKASRLGDKDNLKSLIPSKFLAI